MTGSRRALPLFLLSTLLLLSLSFEGVSSASFNIPSIGQQVVEVWSDWYFISQRGFDDGIPISITITADPTDVDISHSVLQFGNTTRETSFRIRPQSAGDYTITFEMSDGNYDVRFIRAVNRTIFIERSSLTQVIQGYPTEPSQVVLNYPSEDDLTIIPTSDTGSVTFIPSQIVIPEGAVTASFRVVANVLEPSIITYQVTGHESEFYAPLPPTYINSVFPRDIVVGDLSNFALVGLNATTFHVYTPVVADNTVTVTPTAVDTMFFPPSFDFNATKRVASFSYVSSSPAYGDRTVYFDVSGPGASDFVLSESITTGLVKKPINVHVPAHFVINKKTHISVRLGSVVAKDVSVHLYSGNLVFTPNNITFSGQTTSFIIEVWPKEIGPDNIIFKLDGTDKDWYNKPASIPLTVVGGTFISPTSWYVPWLWLGVESPKIPVRASIKPNSNVTLIPQAPDMVFTPSQLTFSASNVQQSFTITPMYTNTDADVAVVTTVDVTFIVDGGDYQSFAAPSPISVTVQRRSLQFQWSAHVTETQPNVKNLYLKKQYEFWATALYAPPTDLSVVPTNPYMTFEPSVLQFNPSVSHIKVIATVEAAAGTTNIEWLIGGKCGGLYTAPAPQVVNLKLRPLNVYQAQIAPDDRVYPGYTYEVYPDNLPLYIPTLGENHVYYFNLRSNVIPDKPFTITPRSKHITFVPASYELTFAKSLQNLTIYVPTTTSRYFNVPDLYVKTSNFSVDAQAPGVHEVWFELSGEDAPYYDVPDNIWIKSTKELRLASEISSASMVYAASSILLMLALTLSVLL